MNVNEIKMKLLQYFARLFLNVAGERKTLLKSFWWLKWIQTFGGDKCLTKANHAVKTGVLNLPAPVRMTPCHPKLPPASQDFVDEGHLDREIWGDKCLTSWSCYEDRCPVHPSSCQDDPLSSQILTNSSNYIRWDLEKEYSQSDLHLHISYDMDQSEISPTELEVEVQTNFFF